MGIGHGPEEMKQKPLIKENVKLEEYRTKKVRFKMNESYKA